MSFLLHDDIKNDINVLYRDILLPYAHETQWTSWPYSSKSDGHITPLCEHCQKAQRPIIIWCKSDLKAETWSPSHKTPIFIIDIPRRYNTQAHYNYTTSSPTIRRQQLTWITWNKSQGQVIATVQNIEVSGKKQGRRKIKSCRGTTIVVPGCYRPCALAI